MIYAIHSDRCENVGQIHKNKWIQSKSNNIGIYVGIIWFIHHLFNLVSIYWLEDHHSYPKIFLTLFIFYLFVLFVWDGCDTFFISNNTTRRISPLLCYHLLLQTVDKYCYSYNVLHLCCCHGCVCLLAVIICLGIII